MVISSNAYAQEVAVFVDCADDPDNDPSFCRDGLDCGNPRLSICSACINPGALEFCKDNMDNNCNQDESELLDSDPNTGVDRKDISCCDIFWWNWTNEGEEVIDNAFSNQQVFLSVRGTAACVGKSLSFDIFEQDTCFNPLGGDQCGRDDVSPDPISAIFDSNGLARTPWTTVYMEDEFAFLGDEPEYRFNVTVFDAATNYFSELSDELQVSRARECRIRNVLWSNSCSANGNEVVVTVIGDSCNNKAAELELYEYETAFERLMLKSPDDYYNSEAENNFPIQQPGAVNFIDNKAIKQIILQYHNENDDGENKDLEYVIRANIVDAVTAPAESTPQTTTPAPGAPPPPSAPSVPTGSVVKITSRAVNDDETSDVLKVKPCNNAIDSDCDNIPDTRDLCLNTPVCSDVDDDGCTRGQQSCLAEWDCSDVEWNECDEDTGLKIRDIGDCSDVINNPDACRCRYLGTNPLCQTEFRPVTSISCIEEEEFPFFTVQNIILVILILAFYYFILLKKKKKKPRKKIK